MKTLTRHETIQILHDHGLDRPAGAGFAFRDRARHTLYDWHTHPYHQLIYASAGAMQIETTAGRHILPMGQAAWIPAHTRHRTMITDMEGASLYFSPEIVADTAGRVRILTASPLMREMILHAARWPLGASVEDPLAASFFRTLALLCGEWLDSEMPLFLPSAALPALIRAMDYALAAPGSATQAGAIAAAALSERSFRRAFKRETGLGWQEWLTQARMMQAMGLLMEGKQVTDVADTVGYASLSAFAKAFAQVTGEKPASFRQRHARANAARRGGQG